MYELAKFLHVATAIIWVGGALAVWSLNLRVSSAGVEGQRALAALTDFLGRRLFQWMALASLVTGFWLVLAFDQWEFEEAWIAIGIAGVVISGGIGGALISPVTRAMHDAFESGDAAAAARHRQRLNRLAGVDLVVLWVVVAAMVFKWGA